MQSVRWWLCALIVLGLPAQIEHPPGNILAHTTGWTLLSGTYLAAGGEDHPTIGNFYDDATSAVVQQPSGSAPFHFAYYYIHDVKVLGEPGPGWDGKMVQAASTTPGRQPIEVTTKLFSAIHRYPICTPNWQSFPHTGGCPSARNCSR
jgi:hypothetical protein